MVEQLDSASIPSAQRRRPHETELHRRGLLFVISSPSGAGTSTPTADVEPLIELLVQFLLLGVEIRHFLLLGLLGR